MAQQTHIEWTDATWNPITGCTVVSPGCTNCYAMRLAGGRLQHHPSREGLTQPSKAGPVWTGAVRLNQQWIDQPMRWTKPADIFVCAHGDLFHPAVPTTWIDEVFGVMALARHHRFQVLTKRADRQLAYMRDPDTPARVIDAALRRKELPHAWDWPMRHVWHGVSVEDQERHDERVADLRATPAWVRWISAEPLLGPVQLDLRLIDWVVVGGESGPRARRMQPDWARGIRDQCEAEHVAFFFKQWGAYRWVRAVDTDAASIIPYRVPKTTPGHNLLDGCIHLARPQ